MRIYKVSFPEAKINLQKVIKAIEHDLIAAALVKTNQNRTAAAKALGIKRTTLVEKLRKHCIPLKDTH